MNSFEKLIDRFNEFMNTKILLGIEKRTFPFEIKYMGGMVEYLIKNSWRDGWNYRGAAEADISNIENKINKKFPLAYREYLLIAGNETPFIQINAYDYQFDFTVIENDYNLAARNQLDKYNKQITRHYWVFASCVDLIYFFFFDEGDNPPVYSYDIQSEPPRYPDYISKDYNTFTEYIDVMMAGYDFKYKKTFFQGL